tara:strand:+ start:6176 stop:7072 length:897 start_codon:yes stop_codon:yes gene_type:complete
MTLEITDIDYEKVDREYKLLRDYARNVTQVEKLRIAIVNRFHANLLQTLGDSCPDQDSIKNWDNPISPFWDLYFDEKEERTQNPLIKIYEAELALRTKMVKTLKQILKANPHMKRFVDQTGLGSTNPMLMARFLGEIGHPVLATPKTFIENDEWVQGEKKRTPVEGEPFLRSVRQLWAYTGMGDPKRRRSKKMSEEDARKCGKTSSKGFIFLLAEACIKFEGATEKAPNRPRSPYRDVYDEAKVKHQTEHQTGVEDDWSDGHCHMSALRLTCKAILKDLYKAAYKDLFAGEKSEKAAA